MALEHDEIQEGEKVRVERVLYGSPEMIVDWVGIVEKVSEDGECRVRFVDGSFWYLWASELVYA